MQLKSTSHGSSSVGAAGTQSHSGGGAASSALLKSISFLSKSQKPKVIQPKIIQMDDSNTNYVMGNDSILSVNEGLPPALLIQSSSGDQKGSGAIGRHFMDQSLNRQVNSSSDVVVKTAPSVGAIPKPAVAAGPIKEPPAFEPRTYQILIKADNRFEPENLKIEKGSIVEWRISTGCSSSDHEEDFDSFLTKSHVIAFESPEL